MRISFVNVAALHRYSCAGYSPYDVDFDDLGQSE
jgi:hypothetical protein